MIQDPQDWKESIQDSSGISATVSMQWNHPAARLNANLEKAQKYVDSEVLRLSAPYTPLITGNLINSGIRGTVIGSGLVVWNAVYARKQYYNTAQTRPYDPRRGAYWFERMKADHGNQIIAGAKKIGGEG